MNSTDKQKLSLRTALIAGIFTSVISIIMLLNFWQLKRTDPLESELLKNMVERLENDRNNIQLKEEIRRLDLIARQAYFTSQWQIRTGGYLLVAGAVIMIIALRYYYSYTNRITVPENIEKSMVMKVLVSHRWVIYTIVIVFGSSLVAAIFSEDHLSKSYALTDVPTTEDEPEIEEILIRDEPEKSNETNAPAEQNLPDSKTDEMLTDVTAPDVTEEKMVISEDIEQRRTPEPVRSSAICQFPAFRGVNGLGISMHKNIPTDWDGASGRNILWKSEIPAPGYNSPVIWDDKLFLTGADNTSQFVFCYSTQNGELLWQHSVNDIARPAGQVRKPTEDTGYAASTVTTDGRFVFAIFATGDVVCVDFKGNRIWGKNIGIPDNHYGHSSSLLLFKGLLLIQFDSNETGRALALFANSGEQKWEISRNTQISWASPILADMGDHYELILASAPLVAGYDPITGEELWGLECLMGEVGPSPAFSNGLVFAANEYARLCAIKPGTPAEMVWETNEYLPEVSSPVADKGLVFIATSYGVIACYDAENGELLWEHEVDNGFYASPMIAENKVFFLDTEGVIHIFSNKRTKELLGEPALGEATVSTPAFMDGRIFLRSKENLYCIGEN